MTARRMERCDICAIRDKLRRFYLIADVQAGDKIVRRGVGSMILCARCWSQTAGKRRRPRTAPKPQIRIAA
jgi:hypothetical protein